MWREQCVCENWGFQAVRIMMMIMVMISKILASDQHCRGTYCLQLQGWSSDALTPACRLHIVPAPSPTHSLPLIGPLPSRACLPLLQPSIYPTASQHTTWALKTKTVFLRNVGICWESTRRQNSVCVWMRGSQPEKAWRRHLELRFLQHMTHQLLDLKLNHAVRLQGHEELCSVADSPKPRERPVQEITSNAVEFR